MIMQLFKQFFCKIYIIYIIYNLHRDEVFGIRCVATSQKYFDEFIKKYI